MQPVVWDASYEVGHPVFDQEHHRLVDLINRLLSLNESSAAHSELAAVLPDLEAPLLAIVGRLVDLLEVVRGHVYDLRFRGSFSIKQVAPVLAPGVGYGDLSIRDGLTASDTYARLIGAPDAGSPEVTQTLAELRAYCARDTLALVALHRALRALAVTPPPRPAGPGAGV